MFESLILNLESYFLSIKQKKKKQYQSDSVSARKFVCMI